jgi:tetratricopeptide (TPR) repeat protein
MMSGNYFLALLIAIGAISLVSAVKRPDWLQHVDRFKLEEYMNVAKHRHDNAVREALQDYDVGTPTTLTEEELSMEKNLIDNLKLNEYSIKAPGKIPDFHDELGEAPVFVTHKDTPLFSKEECKNIVGMADSYFDGQDEPNKMPSGQYYIQGFWIKDVPEVRDWFVERCRSRIFPLLKRKFPDFVGNIEDLVVDNAYLFKYVPQPGLRTEIHTDGGCLSFTFALNSKEEYEGGGTWVEGLTSDEDPEMGEVIEMDVGACTIRPGGIRHSGNPLKKGERYIIGGFCMNKRRVEHVRQLVNNCQQRDSPKKIREALECAIALNPGCDVAYSNLGQIYESQGDKLKAKQVMEDCLSKANPKSCSSSYYLGTMQYQEGNYEEAAKYLQNCLDIDPVDGDALGAIAQCYANLDQKEKEEEILNRIIVSPGVSNRVICQAYCNLGIMHAGQEVELTYYENSLKADPDNLPALHNLGSAYAKRHEWDSAIDIFRKVVKDLAETEEQKHNYLKMLYQVVTAKMKETDAVTSQEEAMAHISSAMGEQNLKQLMAFQQARR